MISVPDAGLLPSTPRPVRCMNGSITSCGKPCGIGRERRRREHAHQLPVAGRRVLALRALDEPAGDGRRARLRRAALERLDVAEAERLEVRQVEAADGLARRCRACRSPRRRTPRRRAARPRRRRPARLRRLGARGYPRRGMTTVLGLLGIVALLRGRDRARGGVTWLVVKLSPAKKPKPQRRPADARDLDRRQRQDVLERRVVEAVRLGDRLVRDLAVDDVDAERERRIPRDGLPRARGRRSPRRTAASRSSTPSSR